MILVGTCYVGFKELLLKNYDANYEVSPIVSLHCIIYGERKSDIVGALNLKLKMRSPIRDSLETFRNKQQFIQEAAQNVDKINPTLKSRKLVIQVDKISGMGKRGAIFVFYKLYTLNDVSTSTLAGMDPMFNHISTHDLPMNDSVTNYFEERLLGVCCL